MRRICLGLILLIAFAVAPASATAEPVLPAGFSTMNLAEGLEWPTALAFAPDGRMFVAEKAGRLRVVSAAGNLRSAPVLDISSHVNNHEDRGLLGLALDSGFATNGLVYLLYTYEADPGQPTARKTSRLVRIRVHPDNSIENPAAPETVLLGSTWPGACPQPADTVDCIPSDSGSHSIGTVRADADGTLWVGSGDGSDYNNVDPGALRTYDERSLSGKILHVDRDGRGLEGHAFCPSQTNLNLVCTKGSRQRLSQSFPLSAAAERLSTCRRCGLVLARGARPREEGPQLWLAVLGGHRHDAGLPRPPAM